MVTHPQLPQDYHEKSKACALLCLTRVSRKSLPKHVSPSRCESGLPPWSSSESRNGSETVKGLKSLSELRKMLDRRHDEQMSGDRLCCPIRLLQPVTCSLNPIQSKPNFSALTAEKVQMCEFFAFQGSKVRTGQTKLLAVICGLISCSHNGAAFLFKKSKMLSLNRDHHLYKVTH